MRILVVCTAQNYQISDLADRISKQFTTTLFRDVIHINVSSDNNEGDIFFFSYGVLVCWGISDEQLHDCLSMVQGSEETPLQIPVEDEFIYSYGDQARINGDTIVLPKREVKSKFAVSHALAQSAKLNAFELRIQKTINETRHLPEELAQKGRIPLSRKEISRKMGELFIERSSINLHFDVLDTPEIFWEYTELEPLYRISAEYLDISTRVDVLNQRLDIVHELFEMLGNELNHQHSSSLEWIIIWLIVIEVILTLGKDVFRLF